MTRGNLVSLDRANVYNVVCFELYFGCAFIFYSTADLLVKYVNVCKWRNDCIVVAQRRRGLKRSGRG